jgi:hypothetical protein
VNSKIDRKHLKQVALTRFDIQLLSLLFKSGGEYPVPETPEGQAMVETTRAKNLVTIITRYGERPRVRLTDEGRIVLAQLEAMAVQPKVEVQTTGALPPEMVKAEGSEG